MGEGGGRLAQAHVVGEAAAEAEPVEELEPAEAALLVRAQGGGEARGHIAVGESGIGKAVEQFGRPPGAAHRRFGRGGCIGSFGGLDGALQLGSEGE